MRYLFLDQIVTLDLGHRASGIKTVSADEEYFDDHFPGYPVVPGALVLEAMAQLGGRLLEATVRANSARDVLPVVGMIGDARFHHAIRPGDRMDLHAEIISLRESAARVAVRVEIAGCLAASAEITFVFRALAANRGEMSALDVERLRAWSRDVWRELGATEHGPGSGPR